MLSSVLLVLSQRHNIAPSSEPASPSWSICCCEYPMTWNLYSFFLTTWYSTRSHLRKTDTLVARLAACIPYFIKNKIADGAPWRSAGALSRRSSLLEYYTMSLCKCKCISIYVRTINLDSDYSLAPRNEISVNDGPHIRLWSHKIIIYCNVIL